MYISREHPKTYDTLSRHIKERLSFRWLTDVGDSDYTIRPRLEHILKEMEDFITENVNSQFIIVLENIEYLVNYIGSFDTIHLFMANLCDLVTTKNGILLIPISKDTFSENERALLSQELIEHDYTG